VDENSIWRRHNLLHVGSRIVDSSSGCVLAADARWARSRKERRIGLIGSNPLNTGEALIIVGGFQVHTFRMTFPIDVVSGSVPKDVIPGAQLSIS
jgi:hypothetical protein